ncbi:TPA: thioredoxin [Candidatus Nomurabacteria bacterium]|nr:MAG: Vitamin K epoxide reductase [Parcubacteria bacterium RAAC4_OD1_1]HCY26108.1 thioredoxin [Candidatus Nomurabacteria bacterium]
MTNQKRFILFIILLVLIVGAVGVFANMGSKKSGKLDGFAQCLVSSGAKFYGTFWCPHCQSQKKMFGSSAKYLPYIECSTPNGAGQLDVCKENGIEGYPTWVFADGSRLSGELPLQTLSEKTSCPLPVEEK